MEATKPDLAIQDFARIAQGFCAWCEGETPGATPFNTAARWLEQLHAAALALPAMEPESDDCVLRVELSESRPTALAPFWDITCTLPNDEGMDFLGDDLTDIYLDVKSSLDAYEAGQVADAVWQWRFDHEIHWGRHAARAMAAIQFLGLAEDVISK